MLLYFCAVNFR